jgi:hypothetical protein
VALHDFTHALDKVGSALEVVEADVEPRRAASRE